MKQFLLILKVILANWKKTKGQLIFTILGIAIASTLWSSIDIVNNQTIKAQKRSIELLQSAFKPIIIDKELPYVSQADFVQLRLNGWLINPVIKSTLGNSDITILGIDFLADYKNIFNSQNNLTNRNIYNHNNKNKIFRQRTVIIFKAMTWTIKIFVILKKRNMVRRYLIFIYRI